MPNPKKSFIPYLKKVRAFLGRHKILRFLIYTGFFFSFVFTAIYFALFAGIIGSIPNSKELKNTQNFTSSQILSEDGVLMGKYYVQDRTNITFQDLSPDLVNALIATEDARFYRHSGVDNIGLLRVFVKSIILGDESSGGGSTLSQQLAKNLYPRKNYWIFSMPINKLKEAIIAQKLEKIFSKEEIIAFYLNTVPFGENAFGIASASKRFFNTTPKNLKVEEAAVLVGMLKAVTSYNPKRNPERSKLRRNIVLQQMVKYEYLPSTKADSLKQLPLKVKYKFVTHNDGLAPYFREFLRLELQKWCNSHLRADGKPYNLYTDGLKIYTTLNSKMQKYAEQSVKEHMTQLQKQFHAHWGKSNPWGKNNDVIVKAMQRSDRYSKLKAQGYSDKEIIKIFQKPVKMRIFTYKGEVEKEMSPWDSLKHYQYYLRAGFLAVDAPTGEIKAWVGGVNHKYFKYDHVNEKTKRQVGSTFKPLVYAEALEQGIGPCEYFTNEKKTYEDYDNWTPGNSNGEYGGKYSMKGGLTNSVNTVSAQVILKAGINNVVNLAKKLGIESDLDPVPSLALGTADISLFEMVGAYSVFPNRGYYVEPVFLVRIEDQHGKVIEDFSLKQEKTKALRQETADLVTEMLQNVVNVGTASRLRTQYGLKFPIAGKTGTTQAHADGWFMGYTPTLLAGAWVGAEDRRVHFRSIDLGQGASMALPIWGKFFSKVYADKSFKKYKSKSFQISPEALDKLSCADYLPPVDTTTFWDKIFVKEKDKPKRNPQYSGEENQKYQETFQKIRNFFRRDKGKNR